MKPVVFRWVRVSYNQTVIKAMKVKQSQTPRWNPSKRSKTQYHLDLSNLDFSVYFFKRLNTNKIYVLKSFVTLQKKQKEGFSENAEELFDVAPQEIDPLPRLPAAPERPRPKFFFLFNMFFWFWGKTFGVFWSLFWSQTNWSFFYVACSFT